MLALIPWLVAAALLSAVLLNILSRTSLAKHFADMPGHRKVHERVVPRLGGIGIVLSFLVLITTAQTFGFWDISHRFLLSVVFTSLFILVAGAFDDTLSLGYRSKFLLQFLLAGIVVCAFGLHFDKVSLFTADVSLGGLGMVVSIFWMVGLMNAINLIDGIDGLAGGVAVVGFAGVAALAFGAGDSDPVAVCALLSGAVLGFLYYNFQDRRKIFLGDTGSQFLGAMLALLTLEIHDS
ncbi:MAG TPA: MraY family glycosyltransferase, partial [Fibrobacteria bacterium]|nr:MraY family glycosyltransferase [Fibrobacteria bacterium]